MTDDALVVLDYQGVPIRLTFERPTHILEHPEMVGQANRLIETLQLPDTVIATSIDSTVHVYHRYYSTTPVTSKFLLVAVKLLDDDAFVLTAFFSNRMKRGDVIWTA